MHIPIRLVMASAIILTSISLPGQTLTDLMNEASQKIGEVVIEDDTYRQQWAFEEQFPYRITYKREEIDRKGKSTEYVYEFNLADLNDRLVNRETSKAKMYVSLKTQGLLSAIKQFKNGEQENYAKEIEIVVNGPDEADALIQTLREAVPKAIEIDAERIVPQDFSSALERIAESVQAVSINDETHEQKLTPLEGKLPLVNFEVRAPKGKDIQLTESRINLADISEPVSFDVKGSKVVVNLRTRGNLKFIGQTVDSEPDNYTNSIEILTTGVEQARDMTKLFNFCIPEARNQLKASLPALKGDPEAVSQVSERIREVTVGETAYEQSLTSECQAELTITETDERESKTTIFQFNLGDLNGNQAQIEVKGKNIGITVPAKGKQRLIREEEDGEFKGYVNEFFVQADQLENARMLEHLFPAATEWCSENRKRLAPEGGLEEKLEWTAKQVAGFRGAEGEIDQNLRWTAQTPCDLAFEIGDGKKLETYEFRLEDLGANQIGLDVSSRRLEVSLGTQKEEDLIKYYQDGEMKRFVDQFSFELGSLSIARDLVVVFKEMSSACQE